jgi:Tol biopolymer transport system component
MFQKPLRVALLLLTIALLSVLLTVRTPATAEISQLPPQLLLEDPISRLSMGANTPHAGPDAASNYPDIDGPVPGSFTEGNVVTEAMFYYAAFSSDASDLVEDDDNDKTDIFVATIRDGVVQEITLITSGASSDSWDPSIAVLGQDCYKVAFASAAPDLVTGDTNNLTDIFVYGYCDSTSTIQRVNIPANGQQATSGISLQPAISADGSYVAFSSTSALASDDTNSDCDTDYDGTDDNCADIYVYNLIASPFPVPIVRVSVASDETQADAGSWNPDLSYDGRYIAFESVATNLIASDDDNGVSDIFVRDRVAGTTIRVSVRWNGNEPNNESTNPAISADGCLVAFQSQDKLIQADEVGWDIYVRDRCATPPTNELISQSSLGVFGDAASTDPAISADGCVVVFESWATNLDTSPGAQENVTDGDGDIFYRSRGGGTPCDSALTERISLHDDDELDGGRPSQDDSVDVAISSDGHYIVFKSRTRNIVGNDTNREADIFIVYQP